MSIRYRDADGGHTDVIGYLVAGAPTITVRAKDGVVEIHPDAVVAVRELSAVPVRNSQIRTLEHAAALGWPGTEQHWHRGWLLRAADGFTSRANSAVPLDMSCSVADLPGIVDWYTERGLPPWLALPERLLPVRAAGVKHTRVMVRDLDAVTAPADVRLHREPDAQWLACYRREVPAAVLTAVVDGAVRFASVGDVAVGRGAVTTAPDGTRWLGIAAVRVAEPARRRGHARAVCAALQHWGAEAGAQRAYVQVLDGNRPAITLYTGLGFGLHHHHRYVDARSLLGH